MDRFILLFFGNHRWKERGKKGCGAMKCAECYSENPRVTPIFEAEYCLKNHKQYICSTCGRHICMDTNRSNTARCFQPFSNLETAKLYLKCAEILAGGPCSIYEFEDMKSKHKTYLIFHNKEQMLRYLKGNPMKLLKKSAPVYVSPQYQPITEEQIKVLKDNEVRTYLEEQRMTKTTAIPL